MSTLVRIKRPLNEDPLDLVLLNYKRKKLEDSCTENFQDKTAIFNFAGTVKDIQEDVSRLLKPLTKIEAKKQYKTHNIDIIDKLRQQKQETSKDNRLKVINSFRSSNSIKDSDGSSLNCTIVDIESHENEDTITSEEATVSQKKDFVYDLYYTNSDDFGDDDIAEFITAYPLSDELIYGYQHKDGDLDSEHSEDSNAEDNWRNDYPDESDVESMKSNESITENDMIRNMNKVSLYPVEDLSSDECDALYGYEYENPYNRFKKNAVSDNSSEFYYDESCTP